MSEEIIIKPADNEDNRFFTYYVKRNGFYPYQDFNTLAMR